MTTQVLVIGGNHRERTGIKLLMAGTAEMSLITPPEDHCDTAAWASVMAPDLVLVIVQDATELAGLIATFGSQWQAPVLVWSDVCPIVDLDYLIQAGVTSYIFKNTPILELLDAIRLTAKMFACFSPGVTAQMRTDPLNGLVLTPTHDVSLSQREWQLLELLACGWNNHQIAAKLGLAHQTVRNYLSRVYLKIGVQSRAEVIVWALSRIPPRHQEHGEC